MSKSRRTFAPFFAAVALAVPALAGADVLLMQRVQEENAVALPGRGMSMAQVESRYGAPSARMDPRGGDSHLHPVINRWEYSNFIVYFEREHVIDAVMKQATPTELGPKQVR